MSCEVEKVCYGRPAGRPASRGHGEAAQPGRVGLEVTAAAVVAAAGGRPADQPQQVRAQDGPTLACPASRAGAGAPDDPLHVLAPGARGAGTSTARARRRRRPHRSISV